MTKDDMNDENLRLYDNLKILSDTAFPKKCAACGLVFNSPEDFITNSKKIYNSSGLKSTLDEDNKPVIELFRNCICGSTLMEVFHDRRNPSAKALKRREAFGNIMKALEKKGTPGLKNRVELLKFMKGERSEFLEKLSVIFRKA